MRTTLLQLSVQLSQLLGLRDLRSQILAVVAIGLTDPCSRSGAATGETALLQHLQAYPHCTRSPGRAGTVYEVRL